MRVCFLKKKITHSDFGDAPRLSHQCVLLILFSLPILQLFSHRYILESGEFRLGAGPQTDCRLDSWTENPLCASFELQLTEAYQPVCDYACAMWSPDSDNAYVKRELVMLG